MPDQV